MGRGSRGDDVKRLQIILNEMGYSLVGDGIFGSNTEAVVKGFQKNSRLEVDGIVGSLTWYALMSNMIRD
ncbi:peptidoglycan-binding protein [Hydrocoleum sp. CS-953]|uniref:peptidoglycan-binding domain-containing protein n=1 Tax=Hydrocoleum sp. CS-953 TaxID=1671698 RepID=UPI00352A04B1